MLFLSSKTSTSLNLGLVQCTQEACLLHISCQLYTPVHPSTFFRVCYHFEIMPLSELDGVRTGGDPLSPLSPITFPPSGLHINPEPGEESDVVQSPTVYDPGENFRRVSLPSASRQGSMSYQGNGPQANNQRWDSHISDPQSADTPYVNHATHPRRGSSTSQSDTSRSNERRDSNYEYTQAERLRPSNPLTGNLTSSAGQGRRPSLPLARRESIPEEGHQDQRRDSDIQPLNNLGRTGSNPMNTVHEMGIVHSVASSESLKRLWWRRLFFFIQTDRKQGRWVYVLFPLTLGLLIGLIVALVSYFKLKNNGVVDQTMPTPTTPPQSSVLPIPDSSIGAADAVIGTYFSTAASGVLQTKVVYNAGGGRLCIRTKSGEDWLNVQCLEGANPRSDTPLTVLDWLGGPSIYFITADNFLSGIDHMPVNGKAYSQSNLLASGRTTSGAKAESKLSEFQETPSIEPC
jgi:hypothetical protein